MRFLLCIVPLIAIAISSLGQSESRCRSSFPKFEIESSSIQLDLIQWKNDGYNINDQLLFENKLIKYLYSNMVYPSKALDSLIGGHVYIEVSSGLSELKIVREIGGDCVEQLIYWLRKFKKENFPLPSASFTLYAYFNIE